MDSSCIFCFGLIMEWNCLLNGLQDESSYVAILSKRFLNYAGGIRVGWGRTCFRTSRIPFNYMPWGKDMVPVRYYSFLVIVYIEASIFAKCSSGTTGSFKSFVVKR